MELEGTSDEDMVIWCQRGCEKFWSIPRRGTVLGMIGERKSREQLANPGYLEFTWKRTSKTLCVCDCGFH